MTRTLKLLQFLIYSLHFQNISHVKGALPLSDGLLTKLLSSLCASEIFCILACNQRASVAEKCPQTSSRHTSNAKVNFMAQSQVATEKHVTTINQITVTIFCSRYFFFHSYTIRKPDDVFQISEKIQKRAINPQVIKYKLYTSMHNTLLFCSMGNFSLSLFKVVFLTSDSEEQFMNMSL